MDISYEYLYDLCSDDNRCADGSIGRHYFMPCATSHEFYEVWRYTGKGLSDMYRSYPVNWNRTDSSGRRVPGGIYLYKAIISTDNEHEATRSKKLCVTGQ